MCSWQIDVTFTSPLAALIPLRSLLALWDHQMIYAVKDPQGVLSDKLEHP